MAIYRGSTLLAGGGAQTSQPVTENIVFNNVDNVLSGITTLSNAVIGTTNANHISANTISANTIVVDNLLASNMSFGVEDIWETFTDLSSMTVQEMLKETIRLSRAFSIGPDTIFDPILPKTVLSMDINKEGLTLEIQRDGILSVRVLQPEDACHGDIYVYTEENPMGRRILRTSHENFNAGYQISQYFPVRKGTKLRIGSTGPAPYPFMWLDLLHN